MPLIRPHAETAAAHVCPTPTARADETVQEVLAKLRAEPQLQNADIYVVEPSGLLVGYVPIQKVLSESTETLVSNLITERLTALTSDTDQERVALHAVRHHLTAVPIEDGSGRFIGVVPATSLLEILHHEHVEDLHRLAGIRRETRQARHALEVPPLRRARDRLPWLLVGLLGSSFAAWVMAAFERTLETRIAVAFFIPGIVYLADAIGTQTEAVAVRFLSLSHASFRQVLGGEMRTGLLIGLALGSIALPAVAIAMGEPRLAVAVALSIVVAGGIATTVGLLFPWALARMGNDPAFGSGPLATIVQDVLSLLVYFAIASALL